MREAILNLEQNDLEKSCWGPIIGARVMEGKEEMLAV